jgi:hypothetical protein
MQQRSEAALNDREVHLWPFIVAIVALLLAIPRVWPYGYYQFLRFLVCGVAIYGALHTYHNRRIAWCGLLAGMALLFNPLIPIHLSKSTWSIVDFMTATLLAIFVFIAQRKPQKPGWPSDLSNVALLFWPIWFYGAAVLFLYFQLYVSKILEPYLLSWVSEENAKGVSFLIICAAGLGILFLVELGEDWLSDLRYRRKLLTQKPKPITGPLPQVDGEVIRHLVSDAIKTQRALYITTKLGSEFCCCRVLKQTASSFHAYCKQTGKLTWFDFNEIDRAALSEEYFSLPASISLRLNY